MSEQERERTKPDALSGEFRTVEEVTRQWRYQLVAEFEKERRRMLKRIDHWKSEYFNDDKGLSYHDYLAYRARQHVKLWRWAYLRQVVWERDKGLCQVCRLPMEDKYYECGHIVDRCSGGKDELDNLAVMCVACNRKKPFHHTREEYEQWIVAGGWLGREINTAVTGLIAAFLMERTNGR